MGKIIDLEKKVIIVTGAGSGIGRETSCVLAREGATVVMMDINSEGLSETAVLAGEQSYQFCIDLTDTKIVAETEGNEAILAVARLGLGIGLVPQIVLENGPYKGLFKIHTAGNALGYYDVGFIIKKDFSGNIGNKKVFDAVKNILSAY